MQLTTPKEIGDSLMRLRSKIGVETQPVFVPVRDTDGHQPGDCFFNVRRKISRDGGGIQHGWTIWEAPDKLIEGEFHAVWVDQDGALIDITPKIDGEREILFIPDPQRVYEEKPIDNIRLALSDDPAIKEDIRVNEEMSKLRAKYNNGGRGEIPMDEAMALLQKKGLPFKRNNKIGRNDPCPCSSGKKYKVCHGKLNANIPLP